MGMGGQPRERQRLRTRLSLSLLFDGRRRALLFCSVLLVLLAAVPARAVGTTDYVWRNVALGGGGYVTGLVAHPAEKDLIYIRTDIGGLYRYAPRPDAEGRTWVPLTDHFEVQEQNFYGIESVALDPQNPDVVFIAAGKYLWNQGRVFRSFDRGETWEGTRLMLPMGGNGSRRAAGERLVVDPKNSDRVYFGSRQDGLWISTDGGMVWQKAEGLPSQGAEDIGLTFVLADPTAGPEDASRLIVSAFGQGLFQSLDGGQTWQRLGLENTGPLTAMRGAVAPDGSVIATSGEGVFKHAGGQAPGASWQDLTPRSELAYGGLALDPREPLRMIVGALDNRYDLPLFRTRDGGRSWEELSKDRGTLEAQADVPWWRSDMFAGATAALVYDPHREGRLWKTDWSGIWFTDDHEARKVRFTTRQKGHEELVIMAMITPPKGAPVLTGMADANGFRHVDFDTYPERMFQDVGIWNTFGLDHHEKDPNIIARVGTRGEHGDRAKSGFAISMDNGRSWGRAPWPFGQALRVAYSATDPELIVALPRDDTPKRTTNKGILWDESTGVEAPPLPGYWGTNQPLAADRKLGRFFYLYSNGRFYRSEDGGLTWQHRADLPVSRHFHVEADPLHAGVVYVSLGSEGLFVSRTGGNTFRRVETIDKSLLFGLGAARPGSTDPTLYAYATLPGQTAFRVYRSDDLAMSWKNITTPGITLGNEPTLLKGDRQVYGRVFLGTNGRGLYVGAPE